MLFRCALKGQRSRECSEVDFAKVITPEIPASFCIFTLKQVVLPLNDVRILHDLVAHVTALPIGSVSASDFRDKVLKTASIGTKRRQIDQKDVLLR